MRVGWFEMARGKRYHLTPDDQGITPSQLKRLGHKRQIAYMTAWFHHFHEDPVQQTSRDEGEYIYVMGGP
ncbi:hypothetical protein WNX13_10100, partial [Lactobacillus delbrueckii]|uniref:hypothetical protein n=1 Tax=Lactobacillus delbrueckii TaxID=1584 RepID=UPI0030E85DB1